MTALHIPDDWTPTAANINALPLPLRRYIMELETHADPAGTIQENYELRAQVRAVEAMVEKLRQG
jgi:hypothetical protein